MEVCFLASGDKVAWLSAGDVEGKSVKEVKRLLAAELGVPRFRQRIFSEDGSSELGDDEIFVSVPVKVQLVLLKFEQGKTVADPDMIAASQGNDSVALEKSLHLPSDPNLTDEFGRTPWHYAAYNGHAQAIELLLEAGADKDSRDKDGTTALWFAAARRHLQLVRLLVEAGADCNKTRTDRNSPPVYVAAEHGHLDVVRLLVEAGADCNRVGGDGNTPLYAAARQGHLEVVRFLVGAGANCNQGRTVDGATPMDIAAEGGHLEVVRFLRETVETS
eukprot:Skav223657  [mRNA]  locus=scaffold1275:38726:39550:- [translate_table: standard]